jgi:hypothetical protein
MREIRGEVFEREEGAKYSIIMGIDEGRPNFIEIMRVKFFDYPLNSEKYLESKLRIERVKDRAELIIEFKEVSSDPSIYCHPPFSIKISKLVKTLDLGEINEDEIEQKVLDIYTRVLDYVKLTIKPLLDSTVESMKRTKRGF